MATSEFFIPGDPATFATRAEASWKATLAGAPRPCLGGSEQGLRLEFTVASHKRHGQGFDLDNLGEPVLSVLVGALGWFGGNRTGVRWWQARKSVGTQPGVRVWVSDAPQPGAIPAGRPVVEGVFAGPLPTSAQSPAMAAWAKMLATAPVGAGGLALHLAFGDALNIADIATGRVKACIDCLYPLLGGGPGAPHDDRIMALVVEREQTAVGPGGVAIRIWRMAEDKAPDEPEA